MNRRRERNIFTHAGLTWHGEVFEGHGTELRGERTHPVGIGIADPRRSGLHVINSLSKNPASGNRTVRMQSR